MTHDDQNNKGEIKNLQVHDDDYDGTVTKDMTGIPQSLFNGVRKQIRNTDLKSKAFQFHTN